MKLQYLCHLSAVLLMGVINMCAAAEPPRVEVPAHNYPTIARVEYVNECIGRNGGKLAALYQCSCAIDRIADMFAYDDYVEASTFAKYATLPGEAGGEFRDSERGKKLAKSYRTTESDALRGCGFANPQ